MKSFTPLPSTDILNLPKESSVVFSITTDPGGSVSHYAVFSSILQDEDTLIKVEIIGSPISYLLYSSWEIEPGYFMDEWKNLYLIFDDSPPDRVEQVEEIEPHLEIAYNHD